MARRHTTQGKTGRIVAAVAFVVVLLIIGGVILLDKANHHAPTVVTPDVSNHSTTTKDTPTETDITETDQTPKETKPPTVDPSTLNSIDVEPLGVTVFYSKGTPGFQFSVLRAADNTQYAQFTSPDLVGTKCTDDEGVFASIIKDPSENDAQTINQTVKVGDDTYGLSLASAGCTSDTELLTTYQNGFKNGFSNLKSL